MEHLPHLILGPGNLYLNPQFKTKRDRSVGEAKHFGPFYTFKLCCHIGFTKQAAINVIKLAQVSNNACKRNAILFGFILEAISGCRLVPAVCEIMCKNSNLIFPPRNLPVSSVEIASTCNCLNFRGCVPFNAVIADVTARSMWKKTPNKRATQPNDPTGTL